MSALVCKTDNNGNIIDITNCEGYDKKKHIILKKKFCREGNDDSPEFEVLRDGDTGDSDTASPTAIVPVADANERMVGNEGNNDPPLLIQDADEVKGGDDENADDDGTTDNSMKIAEARGAKRGKEFVKREAEAKERTAGRVAAKREEISQKKKRKEEIKQLQSGLPSAAKIAAVKNPNADDQTPPKPGSKELGGGNRSRHRRGGTKRRRKKKSKRKKSKRRKKARKSKRRKSRKKRSKRRRTKRRR